MGLPALYLVSFILMGAVSTNLALNEISPRNNDFSVRLFNIIATEKKNYVASPLSVAVALSMLLDGAGRTTASQIKSALGYDKPTDITDVDGEYKDLLSKLNSNTNYQLSLANALAIADRFPVLKTYTDQTKDAFQTDLLTFTGPTDGIPTVNNWVSNHTNGKITDLLDSSTFSANTVMILINAIYFQGNWVSQFNESLTTSGDFEGSSTPVEFMYQKQIFPYKQSTVLRSKILHLPYKGTEMVMIFILPDKDLADIKDLMVYDTLKDEIANDLTKPLVDVKIPKFKIETEIPLNEPLKSMGIVDAFDDQLADLTKLSSMGGIYVSDVVQKAIIEVNERGTEAAAATAVVVTEKTLPKSEEFHADRSFLFALYHNPTDTLAFIGKFEGV